MERVYEMDVVWTPNAWFLVRALHGVPVEGADRAVAVFRCGTTLVLWRRQTEQERKILEEHERQRAEREREYEALKSKSEEELVLRKAARRIAKKEALATAAKKAALLQEQNEKADREARAIRYQTSWRREYDLDALIRTK